MTIQIARQLRKVHTKTADLTTIDRPRGVRARVFNSINILIGNAGTGTALTFDSERYDTDSFHSTASLTTRLVAPFDGWYIAGACVRFASNATGYRQIFFRINGTTAIAGIILDACATQVTDLALTGVVYQFTAGDYIECLVVQTSGGNLNVNAAAAISPEFWIEKMLD